uniref:Uncharacterized protein n=1 Tax=Meloidogyne javanica TaxID=6303 RepID=A0A915N1K1_MELJA
MRPSTYSKPIECVSEKFSEDVLKYLAEGDTNFCLDNSFFFYGVFGLAFLVLFLQLLNLCLVFKRENQRSKYTITQKKKKNNGKENKVEEIELKQFRPLMIDFRQNPTLGILKESTSKTRY